MSAGVGTADRSNSFGEALRLRGAGIALHEPPDTAKLLQWQGIDAVAEGKTVGGAAEQGQGRHAVCRQQRGHLVEACRIGRPGQFAPFRIAKPEAAAALQQHIHLSAAVAPEVQTPRLAAGGQQVEVLSVDVLPLEFLRQKIEPDKTAIKAAIAAGRNVPGAALIQGAPTIQIRR